MLIVNDILMFVILKGDSILINLLRNKILSKAAE